MTGPAHQSPDMRSLTMTASPPIAAQTADQEPRQEPARASSRREPVQSAIDTAHLSRMTLGDHALEIQVLELFDRQADLLTARMREVAPAGVATLAHTLTGSARGIGAWQVAAAAEALERAVGETTNLVPALTHLAAAVEDARLAIGGLLKDAASV